MSKIVDLNHLVSKVWSSTGTSYFELIKNSDVVSKITDSISYVHPKLKVLEENPDSSIVIVSAPGAVGKTTFAKYFTKEKNGFYWDLSKIKLGDNSFLGTIAEVHGSSKLSAFLDSVSKGEVTLFLDAFDEAEIRSGIDGVLKFIEEIYGFCKTSTRPNIICFSRSETAEFLQLKLMDLTNGNGYSVYEIDYFDEANSLAFIKRELEAKGDNNPSIHPQPFNEAVNSIFNKIAQGMNVKSDFWHDPNLRSFLGYAPVLQTIAGYLHEQNFNEIISRFSDTSINQSGISVITEFIEQLLLREQKKLVSPLKTQLEINDPSWNEWDSLFSPEEQIKIVFSYITKNTWDIFPNTSLPNWLEGLYRDSIGNFITNHPFIKLRKYSSPAFRDYSLAKLLFENGFNEPTTEYLSKGEFATTQLFANFYYSCHEGNCLGQHVGYLYESATSKKQLSDGLLFTYIEKNGTEENKYKVEILSPEDKSFSLSFDCLLNDENFLVFERRLVNADINIQNSKIVFGKKHGSIELNDINIVSDEIVFCADECIINCFDASSTIISRKVVEESSYFKVIKLGDEELCVNWPNSNIHPWSSYNSNTLNFEIADPDLKEKIYSLQRILSPFRKHKKKEFSKHCDYIETKIVGSNQMRQKILQHLINSLVLKKERSINQYIINEDELRKIGINWDNIKSLKSSQEAISFLESIN